MNNSSSKQISKTALIHNGNHQVNTCAEENHIGIQRTDCLLWRYDCCQNSNCNHGITYKVRVNRNHLQRFQHQCSYKYHKGSSYYFLFIFLLCRQCLGNNLITKIIIRFAPPVHHYHINAAQNKNRDAYPGKIQHSKQRQTCLLQSRVRINICGGSNQGNCSTQSGRKDYKQHQLGKADPVLSCNTL